MHESTVNVRVEKVRHGENSAVSERTQIGAGSFATAFITFLLGCLLRAVIEKVHEEGEVSGREAIRVILMACQMTILFKIY